MKNVFHSRSFPYKSMKSLSVFLTAAVILPIAHAERQFIPSRNPRVELLENGREIMLLHDFIFVDGRNDQWIAPAGTVSDGASIPRAFWTVFGAPLEGRYRNAAIIHDYYCRKKSGKASAVHLMFYEACLASGADQHTALIAYIAVRLGGPYWGGESRPVILSSQSDPAYTKGLFAKRDRVVLTPEYLRHLKNSGLPAEMDSLGEIEKMMRSGKAR